MARDKKSMIGFDPLAWLDDDKSETENTPASDSAEEKASTANKTEQPVSTATSKPSTKSTKKEKVKKIDVLGHSIDETALLKGYEIASEVLDEVVTSFYSELFSQYPDVKPLFENTSEKSQASKLSAALNLLMDNLHNEDALNSTLHDMGVRHQAYGALPEHYPVVAELLVGSFKNILGRRWTKAISAAWLELLVAVAETMIAAYEDNVDTGGSVMDGEIDVSANDVSDHPVLQLNSTQDISKSLELKNDMLALINDNDEIDIDASNVERIDGSAIQLLCALFVYAKENNLMIHWVNPSEALMSAAELLGVKQILELT